MKNQIKKENPCLVDTHAHLNFFNYEKDRKEIIEKNLEKGVWIINIGTNFQSSQKALAIAEEYQRGVFASIGLHPSNINYKNFKIFPEKKEKKLEDFLESDFDAEKYGILAESKKIIAIGEAGLDYFYKPKEPRQIEEYKAKQKEIFEKQIDFAIKKDLPLIIHCRGAHDEMIRILKEKSEKSRLKGVIHCFDGSFFHAQEYLSLGFFIGINGIIFKTDIGEAISKIPLDKIILETDCPFLVPPAAEKKRNEPGFLPFIAGKISEIKKTSFEEICEASTFNSCQLFKLK